MKSLETIRAENARVASRAPVASTVQVGSPLIYTAQYPAHTPFVSFGEPVDPYACALARCYGLLTETLCQAVARDPRRAETRFVETRVTEEGYPDRVVARIQALRALLDPKDARPGEFVWIHETVYGHDKDQIRIPTGISGRVIWRTFQRIEFRLGDVVFDDLFVRVE